jgi:hypothetical protein
MTQVDNTHTHTHTHTRRGRVKMQEGGTRLLDENSVESDGCEPLDGDGRCCDCACVGLSHSTRCCCTSVVSGGDCGDDGCGGGGGDCGGGGG